MTPAAFILVFLSVFLHVAWNFISKSVRPSLAFYMLMTGTSAILWLPFFLASDLRLAALPPVFFALSDSQPASTDGAASAPAPAATVKRNDLRDGPGVWVPISGPPFVLTPRSAFRTQPHQVTDHGARCPPRSRCRSGRGVESGVTPEASLPSAHQTDHARYVNAPSPGRQREPIHVAPVVVIFVETLRYAAGEYDIAQHGARGWRK